MFERVLNGVVEVIGKSLDLEAISRRDGWLQRRDPRFVFIFLISMVVVAVLLKNPVSMLVVIIFANVLALASRVPIGWYIKRVWLFVPLFTVVILIPSMTNLITPGQQVGWSINILGTSIYFTKEGLIYAMTFTLRVGAAVSLCVLLVATVEWSKLIGALSQLRFPASFVIILDMTYRYIHVLLDSTANMFMARKSRMVGKPTTKEVRLIGSSAVASLFSKSYNMSEQVYRSMMSRGYTGNARILSRYKGNATDFAFAGMIAIFAAAIILFDLFAARTAYVDIEGFVRALI